MIRGALILLFFLFSITAKADSDLLKFLLSFNGQRSSCDQILVEKTYSDDEKVLKITLQDLAELGDEEVVSGVELKRFEFTDRYTAKAERFGRYQGKRVKEVFTFVKDDQGRFVSVSLVRYKRKLYRYGYSIGGIICRK
ncbi:MAG: hypothetical protein ACJAT2_002484 [Bacteriovoracaceae bacterium]|jgi:hypothetical protein